MGKSVTVKVPKRSGKNLSHRSNFTGQVGTLMPIMCHEPVVGQRTHLSIALDLNLPPLASKTYANLDYKIEAFFVPFRLLFGGFEDWFSGANLRGFSAAARPCAPVLSFPVQDTVAGPSARLRLKKGTLSDMLGNKFNFSQTVPAAAYECSALPYLAYHCIYDSWYRNPQVQTPVFCRILPTGDIPSIVSSAPWRMFNSIQSSAGLNAPRVLSSESADVVFTDGVRLTDFRQRNFGFDYFTQATPSPQLGTAPVITISGSSLSISQIRAANSMQLFKERNVIAGPREVDIVKARYGVDLSDSVAQRPIYLGSTSFNVYSRGIYQSQNAVGTSVATSNPFASVGAEYGSVSCNGSDLLIDDFIVREPGYIMVMGSLVPRATYSSGIDIRNRRYITGPDDVAEMASPLLQNIGNEPIYQLQLMGLPPAVGSLPVFGYVPRFSSWNVMVDEVHGKFCDGEDLSSFLLQRSFTGAVSINSSFLQIPTNYLDQIYAVSSDKGFGYWCDVMFDYRVSNCLSDFAVPSLQDPAYEHGQSVSVNFGGTSL